LTYRVDVRPGAAHDLADAYAWYEARQVGLGSRFLDHIQTALDRIAERPLMFPVVRRDARRAIVPKFPYSIYFRIRGDDVRILAVVHQSRHPPAWQRRGR
jgi:plasmid stabilization system protein ParE